MLLKFVNKVREFHVAAGAVVNDKFTVLDEDTQKLRLKLINEELQELRDALKANDRVAIADALGDLLYVVCGTIVSTGCLEIVNPDRVRIELDDILEGCFTEIVQDWVIHLRRDLSSATRSRLLEESLRVIIDLTLNYAINVQKLPIEEVFDEIHRSNMTKFIDGHRREDGKWIKGPSYTPANLEFVNL